MKNLILIFILLLSVSCKTTKDQSKDQDPPIEIITTQSDSLDFYKLRAQMFEGEFKNQQKKLDSFDIVVKGIKATPEIRREQYDSLKVLNNKLGKELLHDKLIIQNAKYYLNIVNKNPSQAKFLRGWMNRAFSQK